MVFTSTRQSDEQHITITVRLVNDILVGDAQYIQFFNIIMRKCYDHLKLKLVGRNYFDPQNKVSTFTDALLCSEKIDAYEIIITSC